MVPGTADGLKGLFAQLAGYAFLYEENGVIIADENAQLCSSQTAFHVPFQKTKLFVSRSLYQGWK
jgi:hypothetical protein